VIDITSADTSEGTVPPTQFTFNSGDWDQDQTVTVTGVDDFIIDNDVPFNIVLTINGGTADTTGYADLVPVNVLVTNDDDDD
jgi:hypothetical protein